ncbi:MAG: thiamine pyrophosphate-binding protein [Phenylobacterium sp.]|nr:thiamine pyrophosphate-binding protein [Phenylobacterium sp.]
MSAESTPPTADQVTAGELVCRILREREVNTVFCLSGAAHTYLLADMEKQGFRVVSTRTETSTVGAADGYARAKGGIGVAMIVGKQGLPNALGGIRTAQLACSPVIVLASVYEAASREAMDEEPNDQLAMVRPYAKWARIVPSADRMEEFVNAAIHRATTGRPGVAVIGIPTRYAAAKVDDNTTYTSAKAPPAPPEPDLASIATAVELIAGAKRPLILAGTGAALAGAGPELRRLAAMGVPVFGHATGRGLVPEDMESGFPWPLAQVAAKHADVVISLGIRLTQRIGFGMAPRFSAKARFVQVDIDPSEIGRNRKIDVPIVADAKRAGAALASALEGRNFKAPSSAWIGDAIAARVARLDELGHEETGPIHPLRIGRELMRLMPPETIFVADGADIYNWMSGVVRIRSDRGYMDHYPLGSMGIGTALALGATAASQEIATRSGGVPRPVVLVTGDGSFGYYTAELNSATLAGLAFTCVISNDGAWGTEKNGHLAHWDHSINCELGQCDYHLIGQAYGCIGEKIEAIGDLAPALERALAADRTTVLNVLTDPDAGLVRKKDPRLQMVTFEDLPSSLDAHHQIDLA